MEIIITAKNYVPDSCWQGGEITDDLRRVHSGYIKQLVTVLEQKGLDLTNLEAIIVPEHFEEEEEEFFRNDGQPYRQQIQTHGEYQGAVVHHGKNKTKMTIFMRKNCLRYFIYDNISLDGITDEGLMMIAGRKNFWINIMHHELCHVDEDNKLRLMPWLAGMVQDQTSPYYRYFLTAKELFNEYYACRKSASTHNIIYSEKDGLVKDCRKIEDELWNLRNKSCKTRIPTDKFLTEYFHLYYMIMLKCVYALGNYYSPYDEEKRENLLLKLYEETKDLNIGKVLSDLDAILDDLYMRFPNWKSKNDLDEFICLLEKYENLFYVYLRTQDDELCVWVPEIDKE